MTYGCIRVEWDRRPVVGRSMSGLGGIYVQVDGWGWWKLGEHIRVMEWRCAGQGWDRIAVQGIGWWWAVVGAGE